MSDVQGAFDDYLRSLSDDEWQALQQRVRQPANPPTPAPQLDNQVDESTRIGTGRNAGLAEAKRRGYVKD